ncbi:alpha/beta fold hydrolase [Actinokineospora terrae]|uniref:Pimeloyl-ACP methyl ester carboxylesterase n=1 Tax=Actinokineospora terrae TaxID=155974 RepID=A0A1H9S0R8_9PSEU|nr:alpha/beta hydrolase [Actinokineospora terrae]SER78611.1 Pimeloyl-ACP methyl ester carboxylesterase [Actinokineospora terrae]
MNRAGKVAAGAGVLAAAAAAVVVGVRKRSPNEDPYLEEPLGELKPTRSGSVVAADGVVLSYEEVDPADGGAPDVTAVLVHGFAMSRLAWHFQRRDLAELVDPRVRLVLYDHRSHGRSGRADAASSTIDQLADDLDEVLRAVVPDGPIVLIGHSMGGMVVMALAERDPDLFAERVNGVALIGTSAGEVGRSGLPRPLLSKYNPLTRVLGRVAEWQPAAVELIRTAGGGITRQAARAIGFGPGNTSPRLVDFAVRLLDVTPVRVLADFVDTLGSHNRYAALAGLKHCPVLVLSGDHDWMTPFAHAERIAAELPDATLVRVPGAGHLVILEQADLVDEHLATLLRESHQGGTRDQH